MKAAVFQGPGEMEVTEVDRPEVGPEEILIKVGANTVCGTDVRIVRGQKTSGVRRRSIIGHEFAGEISQVGERVGRSWRRTGSTTTSSGSPASPTVAAPITRSPCG